MRSDRQLSNKFIGTINELKDPTYDKNLVFFIPAAYILYMIAGSFGIFGKVIGWLGVIMFGIFALQGLLNTLLGFVTVIGTPFHEKEAPAKKTFWRLLQLLISLGNFAIFVALGFLVYAGMYDLKLEAYIPW